MKMGTIVSPWRYDVAADDALQSARLRCSTILHDASLDTENAGSLAEIQVAWSPAFRLTRLSLVRRS